MLKRTWRSSLALLTLVAVQGLLAQEAPSAFFETLEVRVVNVEVYVTDRRGEPVEGLTAEDFTLKEDGRKVGLSHFSWVGAPAASGDSSSAPSPASSTSANSSSRQTS